MKQVAPLRYDVIFKKAFSVPEIFTAFVRDFLNIELEIDMVEKDKVYDPPIGNVTAKFDLYAEDKKNRIIVDIQHVRFPDHYHRFLHYHCAALLEQIVQSKDYRPKLKVFTLVVLTSGDRHKKDITVTDFDPKDLEGNPIGEIDHKIIYICPKYLNKKSTPHQYHEWMEAMEDSLDEQVDESKYSHPEIQHVFELIEKDKVTPQERAKMFDEYGMEAIKREKIQKIKEKAKEEGKEEGLKVGKEEGLKVGKEEGLKVGKEEGLKVGKEEGIKAGKEEGVKQGLKQAAEIYARNLLSLGTLTEKQIAQVTELTLERVKALKEEQ